MRLVTAIHASLHHSDKTDFYRWLEHTENLIDYDVAGVLDLDLIVNCFKPWWRRQKRRADVNVPEFMAVAHIYDIWLLIKTKKLWYKNGFCVISEDLFGLIYVSFLITINHLAS